MIGWKKYNFFVPTPLGVNNTCHDDKFGRIVGEKNRPAATAKSEGGLHIKLQLAKILQDSDKTFRDSLQLDWRYASLHGELISQATRRPIEIPKPPVETARRDASNGFLRIFLFASEKKLFYITLFLGGNRKCSLQNRIRGEILIM